MSDLNRDDKMALEGVVLETNKGIFKVQVNESHFVTARLGGKIKLNEIKVIVGDRVVVEVSPYDMSLGRIVKRMKL
jgi:translation initiation factor IF-1